MGQHVRHDGMGSLMGAEPFSLRGRTVLVTGAGGGIGAATARLSAQQGADLVLCDLEAPADLASELDRQGCAARAIALDVTDRDATEALISALPRLDSVVAAAGRCVWDDWLDPGWDAEFQQTIDVNLHAAVHTARAALRRLSGDGGGQIVLVTSVAGRMGGLKASPHYVAAKGGVISLVRWLAQKGAPQGVRVNGVAPGATHTAMTQGQSFDTGRIPLGRMADPEEIAGAIVFLCMPAASYICGTILDVNGGVVMS